MLLLKRNPLKRKNNNMEQLQKMGIQIGFLFSGLFGAIRQNRRKVCNIIIDRGYGRS